MQRSIGRTQQLEFLTTGLQEQLQGIAQTLDTKASIEQTRQVEHNLSNVQVQMADMARGQAEKEKL